MLPRPGAAHRNGEGSGGDPPESPGRVPFRRTGPLPVALSRLDRHRWLTREGGLQGQHGGPGEGQWRNGSSWGGGLLPERRERVAGAAELVDVYACLPGSRRSPS